jgi:hypothetical protein
MIACFDPGKSGGIVFRRPEGQVFSLPMPETVTDLKTIFEDFRSLGITTVLLEKVTGFIRVPGRPQLSGAAGVMMKTVGWIEAFTVAYGMRLEEVRPQVWQPKLGLFRKPGEDQTDWKNRLKDLAQRLYPQHKITRKTADAFLLLEYSTKR